MWPFPNFHLLIFKNSILLICYVYFVFCCLFLACLLYAKLFTVLSMVHEYAYFYEYIWKPVYYYNRTVDKPQSVFRRVNGDCNNKRNVLNILACTHSFIHQVTEEILK